MVRNRVKELRKERRLRQEELAGRINISQQTVSRIENGDNALAADILMSLANYFGVSVDYILYRSDSRRGAENQTAVKPQKSGIDLQSDGRTGKRTAFQGGATEQEKGKAKIE